MFDRVVNTPLLKHFWTSVGLCVLLILKVTESIPRATSEYFEDYAVEDFL